MMNPGDAKAASIAAGSSDPLCMTGINARTAVTAKTRYKTKMIAIMISARISQLPINVHTLPLVARHALPNRILRSRMVMAAAGEKRTATHIANTM